MIIIIHIFQVVMNSFSDQQWKITNILKQIQVLEGNPKDTGGEAHLGRLVVAASNISTRTVDNQLEAQSALKSVTGHGIHVKAQLSVSREKQ